MPHRDKPKHTRADDEQAMIRGSSNATADFAVEGRPHLEERDPNTPHARRAERIPEGKKPDQLAEKAADARSRQEALIDEAVEETFPGSDPISPKKIT